MSRTSLYLIAPLVGEDPGALAGALAAATERGEAAAALLPLAPADERTLIKRVKALAPVAQAGNAAVLIALAGPAPEGLDLATVAARAGADGVHVGDVEQARRLRERFRGERSVGVGALRSRHDAMLAGEAEVDYVMFGEPRPDGSLPAFEQTLERAAWWAEIFETPCVAHAPDLARVEPLAATGAEFVALGAAVFEHPEGPARAVALAREAIERAAEARARGGGGERG